MILVGCCGWAAARARYVERFGLVEIQQTFYKPPQAATAQRWREEVPSDFRFTIKAWQLITHDPSSPTYRKAGVQVPVDQASRYGFFRPTPEVDAAWEHTLEIARALRADVVLFQCPARFTPTDEHVADLRAFFRRIDRAGFALAWEPRGDWSDEIVRALCQELDLLHATDPFVRPCLHGRPAYFRLHGRAGYRYRYTDDDLAQLAQWSRAAGEAYVLFNNVAMWEDAGRFQALLGDG